jgi:hypothetical protein
MSEKDVRLLHQWHCNPGEGGVSPFEQQCQVRFLVDCHERSVIEGTKNMSLDAMLCPVHVFPIRVLHNFSLRDGLAFSIPMTVLPLTR